MTNEKAGKARMDEASFVIVASLAADVPSIRLAAAVRNSDP
jgi:hypothetical protein